MKKITTFIIAAALAASMAVPASAASYGLLFTKLSFNTNGGTEIKTTITGLGMTIDLSKYVPEREGYTFTGWYVDEALTEAVTSIKGGKFSKIYAGWEEIKPEEPETEETEATEETTEGETEETTAPAETEKAD